MHDLRAGNQHNTVQVQAEVDLVVAKVRGRGVQNNNNVTKPGISLQARELVHLIKRELQGGFLVLLEVRGAVPHTDCGSMSYA